VGCVNTINEPTGSKKVVRPYNGFTLVTLIAHFLIKIKGRETKGVTEFKVIPVLSET
jgi:hypothetical protein